MTETTEPRKLYAGDRLQWQKSLPTYPAGEWTLHYALFNAAHAYTFSAGADGATHDIDVPSATTATWEPGRYDWTAYVSNGTDQHTVGTGTWNVVANPAGGSVADGRTHARKMLDAVEAQLEGNASTGQLAMLSAAMGDRNSAWKPELLMQYRDKYRAEVAAEERAAAVARGEDRPNFIRVRFGA